MFITKCKAVKKLFIIKVFFVVWFSIFAQSHRTIGHFFLKFESYQHIARICETGMKILEIDYPARIGDLHLHYRAQKMLLQLFIWKFNYLTYSFVAMNIHCTELENIIVAMFCILVGL